MDVETDEGLVRARSWDEPGGAAVWVELNGPAQALYRFPAARAAAALRAHVVRVCLDLGFEVLRVSGPGVPARR